MARPAGEMIEIGNQMRRELKLDLCRRSDIGEALNCTADNLMDFHPPQLFQIDGNLGGTAGMAEMLVQSHLGSPDDRIIELLPALPKAWPTGRVTGIKARGNITLDMAWRDGKLTEATLRSPVAATVRIKNPNGEGVTAYALGADTPLTLHFA